MKLFKEFKGVNGLLKRPVDLDDGFFKSGTKTVLLTWGIFNPYGPTLNIIGVSKDEDEKCELIWFRNFNPFNQENWLLGQCDNDYKMNTIDIMEEILHQNGNEEFSIYKSLPTFILQWSDLLGDNIPNLFWIMHHYTREDLKGTINNINQTMGKPWDRATLEIQSALKDKHQNRSEVNQDIFSDWLDLISKPEYMKAEFTGFISAWSGAIDFQSKAGGLEIFPNVMDFEKLRVETNLSGIDFF